MKIKDALIELLAIKLCEHDIAGWEPNWMTLSEQDRDTYRKIARGEDDLPGSGREQK